METCITKKDCREREFSKEVVECKEIMELLKDVVLMKFVTDVGPCYEKLVKEFIMNICTEYNVEGNNEYIKMYIRGRCVKLPHTIINQCLGRSKFAVSNEVPSIDKITKEITDG